MSSLKACCNDKLRCAGCLDRQYRENVFVCILGSSRFGRLQSDNGGIGSEKKISESRKPEISLYYHA
jgi:hypothetical protein